VQAVESGAAADGNRPYEAADRRICWRGGMGCWWMPGIAECGGSPHLWRGCVGCWWIAGIAEGGEVVVRSGACAGGGKQVQRPVGTGPTRAADPSLTRRAMMRAWGL
jgi:hypothetical protein